MIKRIEGFPNYTIDDLGNIYSSNGKKMKSRTAKSGYSQIILTNNGVSKTFLVHRLVAMHFLKPQNAKLEVNHINGNKSDNRASNLEWISHGDNLKHAYKNGLRDNDVTPKQITGTNINTGDVVRFPSIYEAAHTLHISQGNICMACKGERPYAGGYRWSYGW